MSGGRDRRIDTVVSRDGTEIAYQTIGKGPDVLIVPGALAIADDFDAFARELAERFTVVTIERRGRGQSGPQGDDYGINSECDDLAAVQAATGAKLLFGHSFGEKLRTGGCLHRRQVVALAVDAVVVSLRPALAAPSALDRDHGETLRELARECVEVVRDRKRARDDQNVRPLAN